MRYISLFSGIEAASAAWGPLGWEPVAFCEIEPFPSAVLAQRYPDVPNLGDVTKVDWSKYRGAADIVVGGSPCQSFSIAGLRKGLADPRGNLMLEFLRACEQVAPEWVLWENVPGVLSSNGGRDFQTLLEAVAEIWPRGGAAWRVLDAQFFGVAQRRRRVFLVVNTGDWRRAAAVLFDSEGVLGNPVSGRAKRQELAARAGCRAAPSGVCVQGDIARGAHMGQNGLGGSSDGSCYTLNTMDVPTVVSGFNYKAASTAGSIGYNEELSPTCTSDWHAPAVLIPSRGEVEPCEATRSACGGGKPGGGKGPLIQEEVSGTLATGNDQTLICMADAAANAATDVDACGSLKANNDRNAPIIAFAIDRATTPKVSEEVCHTLRRGGGGDSNDVVAIAANQRGEVRLQGGDGSVTGAIPASQSGKQINAICQYGEVAGALTARGDSSPCADRGPSVVTEGSYVRRLTPRECERLQGFPDDWTRIPWKGKPAEECPDGPRYKAIGNSMAVPVMRWIGERIAEVSSW